MFSIEQQYHYEKRKRRRTTFVALIGSSLLVGWLLSMVHGILVGAILSISVWLLLTRNVERVDKIYRPGR